MILSSPGAVAFVVFGFPIYYYGIVMASALLAGYFTADFIGGKYFSVNIEKLFIPLVLIGFIGARLYYCALNWDYYGHNLSQILNFRGGGLSIHGGILAGAIFLFFYCRFKKQFSATCLPRSTRVNPWLRCLKRHSRFSLMPSALSRKSLGQKKISLWQIAAPICVGLPLAQSIGRWGNFFNSEAYGKPFDGFIKLYVPEYLRPIEFKQYEYFHPTFLYESLADILIFLILFFVVKHHPKPMFITCLYLILYSLIRIVIEFLRIDSVFSPFGIPIAIIVSAIILFFSICGLLKSSSPPPACPAQRGSTRGSAV